MTTFEERFTAWVDGQLAGPELAAFEAELADHPEALAEREDAFGLRTLLQQHPTAPRLPNADFFNHQLRRQIAADAPSTRPKPASSLAGFSFWGLPRLVWLGGLSLAIAGALFTFVIPSRNPHDPSPYFAQVVEAWPSDPSISATTVYNPEENVTVLWLDGLDYIPASNSGAQP